jgi:hypothetical protein
MPGVIAARASQDKAPLIQRWPIAASMCSGSDMSLIFRLLPQER